MQHHFKSKVNSRTLKYGSYPYAKCQIANK